MHNVLDPVPFLTEQNFHHLLSQAPAPICILKGDELRIAFVNDAFSKLLNNRPLLSLALKEALPELEEQPVFELIEKVYKTGQPYYGDGTAVELQDEGGRLVTRYFNFVYNPLINDQQEIEGVVIQAHDVTAIIEAGKREQESDLRFRNIVEQATDPILVLKGEELVLEVANKALLKLWDVGTEAIGKTFLEILPEMREQGFHQLLLDVYHNGVTHNGEGVPAYFKRADGRTETHYFNFVYQPYREADGRISGVLVRARDVTEEILAKESLKHSERNLRNFILQAPVAMCILKGPDHVVEIANKRIYELWGKTEEEALGKPIFEALPEAKGQGLEKLLLDVYTTGETFVASERPVNLPRSGRIETFYINFVYDAFREGDGTITGVMAVATDVTEQVLSRQKIELAEETARLAMEGGELGAYDINLLTNEMVTSARFNEIWGVKEPTTDRSVFASIIHPEDRAIREMAHKQSLVTGTINYEARLNRPDGTQRWVRVKGKVLYDKEGTPNRLIGVIQDITEQKQFANELTLRVEERTKALQAANTLLEKSNEELEQFAYVASHDLQEPMRKIQFYTNMVLEKMDINESVRKVVEKVNSSSHRMTGLIRSLLEYSKISNKSLPFEETDLNLILQQIISDFELLIEQKEATLAIGKLPVICAIPLQMNQLLFNLVGNSLKFTKRGVAPVISIQSEALSAESKSSFPQLQQDEDYWKIIIKDNGIGFAPEYAERMFTIFQTLNEKSLYGGYGIGLAVCRKIVDTHKGIIFAKGKPKEGASFIIILPVKH